MKWLWLLVLPAMIFIPCAAPAHVFSPTVVVLTEEQPGRFRISQRSPLEGDASPPLYPAHCQVVMASVQTQEWQQSVLDCGPQGLRGQSIQLAGKVTATGTGSMTAKTLTETLLVIHFLDGEELAALLHPEPLLIPAKSQPLRLPWQQTMRRFLQLGTEHILAGADHLLFLLGLVALATSLRALLLTVSAFTVGHSLTLVLVTLNIMRTEVLLSESLIALSVVFVARELLRPVDAGQSLRPLVMASLFGLLHGLGFASALQEVGLPAGQLLLSLLSFNLGVELGQLLFVLLLLLPLRWLMRTRYRPLLGYAMGSLAMAWTIERALLLLGNRT